MEKGNGYLDFWIMNRTPGKSVRDSSPSQEQSLEQRNLKQRKRKCNGKKNEKSQKSDNDNNFVETLLAKNRDGKLYNDVPKQENIGSPVVVEAFDNLSLLNIPEPLKQSQQVQVRNDVPDNNPTYMDIEKEQACIIVTESLNPSHESCNPENENRQDHTRPPLENNHTPQKNKKQVKNDVVESTTSPIAGPSSSKTNGSCNTPEKYDTDDYVAANFNVEDGNGNEVEMSDKNINTYSVRFYCLRNKVVAVMSEKARFCFTGKLVVRVIYGAVEAYGCVITTESGPVEIYSPRGYSNVSIETSENHVNDQVPNIEHAESNVWMFLTREGVDRNERHKLADEIERLTPAMTVVLLSNLENGLTRFLDAFYQFRLFPKVKKEKMISHFWTDLRRAELMLQSNLYTSNYNCKELIIDPRISGEVSEKMLNRWRSNKWSCTVIVGGKSVGKSTTTRYLINRLLPVSKKVVLLDVDPGQTECTPYGCLSCSLIEKPLMGPNFTHLKKPVFQLYIGEVNVSRCITRYIEGVKMLIDKISNSPILSRLPIVVNTMGFSQGIGWDLALTIIKFTRPSFVVQIMSGKPKNNYIGYFSKEVVNRQKLPWTANVIHLSELSCNHELFVVRSYAEQKATSGYETWNMEPYQQRELVMISYLSEIVQNSAKSTSRCDALSLSINNVVPYVTSFKSLYISIPSAFVPSSHVLNVVNGNIVALCGIDINDSCLTESQAISGPRVLNRPPLCNCYGFGIVRGVDMVQEEIFINTPLPAATMQYVNCLMGCIPVPINLLTLNQQTNIPYIGGNDILPMSREHRRGYFRMRYQRDENNA
ncbi:polynucleotide 5'-hydroxyl-kinase NOL9 isoform X2 [Ceratina calcarata]|uniref:Polynucleotide 5'-hydroxyl-kinase NOL9 n=1 Tax=Ceratina calcarata TaxID=156304 RepID=A0AAJ7S5K0_9HYME|nr:polynucleotide 5'-hydroxyl-kinase NOL9 isoform X2 [Ceratina calcarata]